MRNHPAWIVKCKFLRILELRGGMYSTYFYCMIYIRPIKSNKLGPTNMAPMASKTWVLKREVVFF